MFALVQAIIVTLRRKSATRCPREPGAVERVDVESTRDEGLGEELRRLVADEQRLADAVREALEEAGARFRAHDADLDDLVHLRQDAAEAHLEDLPALLAQMEIIQSQRVIRRPRQLPDPRMPYFAHMRLAIDDHTRDVLLGYRTFIDARRKVTIVDWRHAPVARVFFAYREGDDYEEDLPGGTVNGTVERRVVVTFDDGRIVGIVTGEHTVRRTADGRWVRGARTALPRLRGGQGGRLAQQIIGTGLGGRKMPVVSALLDEDQYEALERDDDRPLLVVGGAGCGKTTVALHRLATLNYRKPDLYRQRDMIVVVPEVGLVSLTRSLLDELGLRDVAVSTFDDWVTAQGRRVLKGVPRRLCETTPIAVSRFKRHPALRASLADLVDRMREDLAGRLDRAVGLRGELASFFLRDRAQTLLRRLDLTERHFKKRLTPRQRPRLLQACKQARRALGDMRADRELLLSDHGVWKRAVLRSGGDLTDGDVEAVLEHSRLQLAQTAEQEFAHVDPERRQALDGRGLDDRTPAEVAGTVDVEDLALLFELLWLKTGGAHTRAGAVRTYAHMVVDEAQDLAPVELAVLGRALRPDGTVTLAGDPAQQIDPSVRFASWSDVMEAFGAGDAAPIELRTSYRCTRPIAEFAHGVLGPLAPADPPLAAREGVEVARSSFVNEGQAAVFVTEAIEELTRREPRANLAVICHDDDSARRWHQALGRSMRATLVLDGQFDFGPGIVVTSVWQVKGLEFDYVVIPDASVNRYPDTPRSRRLLHVAASRAVHQLWVVDVGRASPILSGRAGR